MSDLELEALKRKKLLELKKSLRKKDEALAKKPEDEKDPKKFLDRFLIGRALEVLDAAKAQYPEAGTYIEETLVKLIREGKIREKITGEELYSVFLRLGLRIRLPTRIRVLEHGEIKSLEEKIKETSGV
jgi:DNA-binding TFAR19-related protein (PDSD5 family)